MSFDHEKCLRADPFAGDSGDPDGRTFADKIVIFRKASICHDCAQEIVAGSKGRSRTDKFDGQMMTFRWCSDCCAAMAKPWTDDGIAWEARHALRRPKMLAAAPEPPR